MSAFARTAAAMKQSAHFFSANEPVFIARAPGRLDLMGGNVDYTGGLVFQATIREATWAAAQLRDDGHILFWNPQMAGEGWCDRVEFSMDQLSSEEAVRSLVNCSPQRRWTA